VLVIDEAVVAAMTPKGLTFLKRLEAEEDKAAAPCAG
jgi:hypothetical protein